MCEVETIDVALHRPAQQRFGIVAMPLTAMISKGNRPILRRSAQAIRDIEELHLDAFALFGGS